MAKLQKPFMTADDLTQFIPITLKEARLIIKAVNLDLKEQGCYVPTSKTIMAPTELVLRKINLNPKEYMK